jgi:hypothetical protein
VDLESIVVLCHPIVGGLLVLGTLACVPKWICVGLDPALAAL